MLIEDIKRVSRFGVDDSFYELHPVDQKELEEGIDEWELSKYDEKQLVEALWRKGIDIDYIQGAMFALDAMADAKTLEQEMDYDCPICMED